MAGVTDVAFRSLCLSLGAAYAPSEMISSDTTLHASSKTRLRILEASGSQGNTALHAVQIAGADPDTMAAAAQFNVLHGAQVIDINMGCPAKKVCRKLAGSALMSDETLVKKILRAVVSAVDVPVTLKIRTGPDPDNRNGPAIAQLAEQSGIACIAVHGRTRADKFTGQAEYDTIAEIKQRVSIPVIANGDIVDAESAKKVIDKTGVDALMIGRAAQGNPFIFREIAAFLQDGRKLSQPKADEVHRVLTQHLQGLYQLYGEYKGVRIARKHISWYCKNKPGSAQFRDTVNRVDSAIEQLNLIDAFFQDSASDNNRKSHSMPSKLALHTLPQVAADARS